LQGGSGISNPSGGHGLLCGRMAGAGRESDYSYRLIEALHRSGIADTRTLHTVQRASHSPGGFSGITRMSCSK
jgi:hypothetical protein